MKIHLKKRNIQICSLIVLMFMLVILMNHSHTEEDDLVDNMRFADVKVTPVETNEYLNVVDYDYVDNFQSLLKNSREIVHNTAHGKCKERRSFVFIKTMKCGTQTLVNMFRRFVYLRHLNFMLPRLDKIYLGWPYTINEHDFRPSKKQFDGLLEHSVYNRTVMKKFIRKDAAYITIIREPFSHFKSSFNYFNVGNISLVQESDHISGYLQNLDKYETFYKSPEGARLRYCIPDGFSVTKNLLSNCLGMPLGFPPGRENIEADDTLIREYIKQLDADFDLVMIMEYFHESLILLKRIMCWSFEDLLYQTSNVGTYKSKNASTSVKNLNIYKKWSQADYILYNYFNATFWKKISNEGKDFHEEVTEFSDVQAKVTSFCQTNGTKEALVINAARFTDEFVVHKDFCIMQQVDLSVYLKTRYERIEGWKEDEEYTKKYPLKTC
ncbi:galactosylceramide sulfotransferase [Mactra antiquata]